MLVKLAAGTAQGRAASTRERGIKIQKGLGIAEITFKERLLFKRDKADPTPGQK